MNPPSALPWADSKPVDSSIFGYLRHYDEEETPIATKEPQRDPDTHPWILHCRLCRPYWLQTFLLWGCLPVYVWNMLDIESQLPLGAPPTSAVSIAENAWGIGFPMVLFLALLLFVHYGLSAFQTRITKKEQPSEASAPTPANPSAPLLGSPSRLALYAARLGLFALALLGLFALALLGLCVAACWPWLLVGGWVSLSLLAAAYAYVAYPWRAGPPLNHALQHYTRRLLRCYLFLLPCYLMGAAAIKFWWPVDISPSWLLIPCLGLGWFYRDKLNAYTDSRLRGGARWPSLGWSAALWGLLGLVSYYALDCSLSEPSRPPYGPLLFALLSFLLGRKAKHKEIFRCEGCRPKSFPAVPTPTQEQ